MYCTVLYCTYVCTLFKSVALVCPSSLVLRSQHTPHTHPQHCTGSHDQDVPSHDPPPSPPPPCDAKGTEPPLHPDSTCKLKADRGKVETTVFIEPFPCCETRGSNSSLHTKLPPDTPQSHKLLVSTPSPRKKEPPKDSSPSSSKSRASPGGNHSPKKRKSTSSQSDLSCPATDQSFLSPTDSQGPNLLQPLPASPTDPCEEAELEAQCDEPSSPSKAQCDEPSSPSKKEKRKKTKSKKDGGSQRRKHGQKRKRGLSTSSSDDPKSSRSRTESGGSELLDMCDSLPGDEDPPVISLTAEDDCPTDAAALRTSSPSKTTPQLQTAGADQASKGEKSKVLFDLTSLSSPTQTSSPIQKDKGTRKKRKADEDGGKKKRSKRKRVQSSSSTEDPTPRSGSRAESLRSETTTSSVLSPVDFSMAEQEPPNYCFAKTQTSPFHDGQASSFPSGQASSFDGGQAPQISSLEEGVKAMPAEQEGQVSSMQKGTEGMPRRPFTETAQISIPREGLERMPRGSNLSQPPLGDKAIAIEMKLPECRVCVTGLDDTPDDYSEC